MFLLDNLLLPIDLLEKHYNVQLPDMEKALSTLGITNANISYIVGPVVITYHIKLELDSLESKVINQLSDPIKWAEVLNVRAVRIIPDNFGTLALEVPHNHLHTISLKDVICSEAFINSNAKLPIALGVDTKGEPIVIDLTKVPHLLIGGMTGAGKSVFINTILISLLSKLNERQLKLMLIAPKAVELSSYNDIPHLITPVITDMCRATQALKWCVDEMEYRYRLLVLWEVRNVESYNQKISRLNEEGIVKKEEFTLLNYLVVVVDEFADLMMVASKHTEECIMRIAQKARSVGIHLILATQRPTADTITGVIKASISSRIAFTTVSEADSFTILDKSGAETLLGGGDMLYYSPSSSDLTRIHSAFVSDEEIMTMTNILRLFGKPQYQEDIFTKKTLSFIKGELDPLFDIVRNFVIETETTSISAIQRKFRFGFNRVANIIDQLESEGVVSEPLKSGKRELLVEKN